jgi:hypothetical protein
MAPREGNSIVKHGGVVDERLNVHGVKGLKVCDLSICPDNVGCNTFSVSPSSPTYPWKLDMIANGWNRLPFLSARSVLCLPPRIWDTRALRWR